MIHVFIVNSISSDPEFGRKLRKHLEQRGDIKYFVFNTTQKGMEASLVDKMIHIFEGEKIRIYACGGSGTMRNAMQGSGSYKNCEFAFYPLGATNDFLKVFGDDIEAFKDIDRLIDGNVEYIDYIRTNYGYALNTVSYGIDSVLSATLEDSHELEIFGKKIPFFVSFARALLNASPRPVSYYVDGEECSGSISELIIGNGKVLGGQMQFTEKADPTDGQLAYLLGINTRGLEMLKIISHMVKGNISEVKKCTVYGDCSSFVLKSADGKDMALNLDGEIIQGGNEWTIEVVKQGMAFVIPKGFEIKF